GGDARRQVNRARGGDSPPRAAVARRRRHDVRRPLRRVDLRDLGQCVEPARLVLVRPRPPPKPDRGGLLAARGRHRVVGRPTLGEGLRHGDRRGRLPRALPPRLRRPCSPGCGPLRAGRARGRRTDCEGRPRVVRRAARDRGFRRREPVRAGAREAPLHGCAPDAGDGAEGAGRVHLLRSPGEPTSERSAAVCEGVLGPVTPVPATLLLASVMVLALTADRLTTLGFLAAVLLTACLRAPAARRRPYLVGTLVAGISVIVVSPFLWSGG